jgi:hypothetical protein
MDFPCLSLLIQLPNELLDAIATPLDKPSLCSFALTCRKTHPAAIDALYKDYRNPAPPSKAPFTPFLRTICERPDLAAKVKNINIRGWNAECEVATGRAWRGLTQKNAEDAKGHVGVYKPTRISETLNLFVGAAVKAGLIARRESWPTLLLKTDVRCYTTMKAERDFVRLLTHGLEDAHALLLLALLPHVEFVRIDGLPPYPVLDKYHFLSRSKTALRRVRWLELHGSSTTDVEPYDCKTLQILDLLPNLEGLVLSNLTVELQQDARNSLPTKSLQMVSLRNVGLQSATLHKMLDSQRLRRFRFVPGPGQSGAMPCGRLSADDFISCLAGSQTTLQSLSVYPTAWNVPTTSSVPPMLRSFMNLTELEMPQSDFLSLPLPQVGEEWPDVDAVVHQLRKRIPSSLKELVLRSLLPTSDLKIILEQLVVLKLQGEYPNLKLVRLNFRQVMQSMIEFVVAWIPIPDPGPLVWKEFGGRFEQAGLQLRIEQTD